MVILIVQRPGILGTIIAVIIFEVERLQVISIDTSLVCVFKYFTINEHIDVWLWLVYVTASRYVLAHHYLPPQALLQLPLFFDVQSPSEPGHNFKKIFISVYDNAFLATKFHCVTNSG